MRKEEAGQASAAKHREQGASDGGERDGHSKINLRVPNDLRARMEEEIGRRNSALTAAGKPTLSRNQFICEAIAKAVGVRSGTQAAAIRLHHAGRCAIHQRLRLH